MMPSNTDTRFVGVARLHFDRCIMFPSHTLKQVHVALMLLTYTLIDDVRCAVRRHVGDQCQQDSVDIIYYLLAASAKIVAYTLHVGRRTSVGITTTGDVWQLASL